MTSLALCIIYRKRPKAPVKVTEYMAECSAPMRWPVAVASEADVAPQSRDPVCSIGLRFVGIYDKDEAERIVSAGIPGR